MQSLRGELRGNSIQARTNSYLGKATNIREGEEETEEVGNAVSPNTAHLRMKGTGASRKQRGQQQGR